MPRRQVQLTLLLQVNHPIEENKGLHQGGQQESEAEEDHHLPLLSWRGWLQGPTRAHPHTLQSPASIPAREGKAARSVLKGRQAGVGGRAGTNPTSWGRARAHSLLESHLMGLGNGLHP